MLLNVPLGLELSPFEPIPSSSEFNLSVVVFGGVVGMVVIAGVGVDVWFGIGVVVCVEVGVVVWVGMDVGVVGAHQPPIGSGMKHWGSVSRQVGLGEQVGAVSGRIEIRAGSVLERTFSYEPALGSMDKTCVFEPYVIDVGVFVGVVAVSASSLMVPTRVVCWMIFERSVPMESVTVILPGVNIGVSII